MQHRLFVGETKDVSHQICFAKPVPAVGGNDAALKYAHSFNIQVWNQEASPVIYRGFNSALCCAPYDSSASLCFLRDTYHPVWQNLMMILMIWNDNMKLFRLSSKCLVWGAGQIPPAAKKRMEAATEEWKGERLGTLLGFKHTKAPNQVTGYLCRLFFAESTRDSIVEAVSKMRGWGSAYRREMQTVEKDALKKLLQRLGVIGRVIASDSHIKVWLDLETHKTFILSSIIIVTFIMCLANVIKCCWECKLGFCLRWLLLGDLRVHPEAVAMGAGLRDHPQVHSYHTWIKSMKKKSRLLSHSTELIVLNGNRGLKRLAEEGNESLHSNQRKTREHAARKFSLAAGDEDTFRLILIKLNTNSKTFTREQRLQLNVHLNKLKARVCLKQPLC